MKAQMSLASKPSRRVGCNGAGVMMFSTLPVRHWVGVVCVLINGYLMPLWPSMKVGKKVILTTGA